MKRVVVAALVLAAGCGGGGTDNTLAVTSATGSLSGVGGCTCSWNAGDATTAASIFVDCQGDGRALTFLGGDPGTRNLESAMGFDGTIGSSGTNFAPAGEALVTLGNDVRDPNDSTKTFFSFVAAKVEIQDQDLHAGFGAPDPSAVVGHLGAGSFAARGWCAK